MITPDNELNQRNTGEGGINISLEERSRMKVEGDVIARDKIITNITINYMRATAEEKTALQQQAADLFATMPTDDVPPVGHLPSFSRMTLRPNPHFVGREEALTTLAKTFKNEEQTAVLTPIAAATGMGGVGKTQTAVEFAHRYGRYFAGGVYWLNMAESTGVAQEVIDCGRWLEIPGFDGLDEQSKLTRVQQLWQEPLPRLLIFDNCEDVAMLNKWRPTSGGSCILITSRRTDWSQQDAAIQMVSINILAREQSVRLLQDFVDEGALAASAADELAAYLGDLPLALHLAGSYLGYWQREGMPLTVAEYKEELESAAVLDHESFQQLEGGSSLPTQHVQSLYGTFLSSYHQLDGDELAQTLLSHAACFEPGIAFPTEILLKTARKGEAETTRMARRKEVRALATLRKLGLLEMDELETARLHRLVVAFVVQESVEKIEGIRRRVGQIVNEEGGKINETDSPVALRSWVNHLVYMGDQLLDEAPLQAGALYLTASTYYRNEGLFFETSDFSQKALKIRQKLLGEHHVDTAESLNDFGQSLFMEGDYDGARPYLEQALAIRQKALGKRHLDTAESLNILSGVLSSQGRFVEAQKYVEEALAIRREALGERHPATATTLNNLGYLLRVQGNEERAQQHYEEVLRIRREVMGERHPVTAESLNNLGSLLRMQGNYEGARPYLEEALSIWREVLGERHLNTAAGLKNFGYLLRVQGNYERARPYLEEALSICREVLGERHPDTADKIHNLALLSFDENDFDMAHTLMAQALEIRETVLGADHPDTQSSRQSLMTIAEKLA